VCSDDHRVTEHFDRDQPPSSLIFEKAFQCAAFLREVMKKHDMIEDVSWVVWLMDYELELQLHAHDTRS
jgi:hypothetical protein